MRNYKKIILIFGVMTSVAVIHKVSQFFPKIGNDVSKVTWGHAINSESSLTEAIKNDLFMMLEADISAGHLKNDSELSSPIPIMAHPPLKVSDISLEMWVDKVIEANKMGKKIGAKLDFKNLEIVSSSLDILRRKSLINFPLWLNADIVNGPGGENKTPVDADIFLSLCTEFFPDATLSLGWTTVYVPDSQQRYTVEMINEMLNSIKKNNVRQPVTFPIRAAFVGSSEKVLKKLILKNPTYTFTIWTSPTDNINAMDLVNFQSIVGEDSVYFDLPEKDLKALRAAKEEKLKSGTNTLNLSLCSVGMTFSIMILSFFIMRINQKRDF